MVFWRQHEGGAAGGSMTLGCTEESAIESGLWGQRSLPAAAGHMSRWEPSSPGAASGDSL
jgi:hypothetical protein